MQQNAAERDEPEAKRVEARKRHVARADLQRHNVVGQAEEHRHRDEKNHRGPVHREQHVVGVRRQEGVVRHGELEADEHRLDAADHEKKQRRDHIQNADALVIDRGEPRHLPVLPLFGGQEAGATEDCGDLVHFNVSK